MQNSRNDFPAARPSLLFRFMSCVCSFFRFIFGLTEIFHQQTADNSGDKRYYRAEYSDFGEDLDLVAPSCDFSAENFYGEWTDRFTKDGIWTTDNSGEYGYKPGDYESDFCGTSALSIRQ